MFILGLCHTHRLRPHPGSYELSFLMPYAQYTSDSFLDSIFNEHEREFLENVHWLTGSALAKLHHQTLPPFKVKYQKNPVSFPGYGDHDINPSITSH